MLPVRQLQGGVSTIYQDPATTPGLPYTDYASYQVWVTSLINKEQISKEWIQFGQPMTAAVTQTLIPVIGNRNDIYGWLVATTPITMAAGTGTQAGPDSTTLVSATLPVLNESVKGGTERYRLEQYICIVLSDFDKRINDHYDGNTTLLSKDDGKTQYIGSSNSYGLGPLQNSGFAAVKTALTTTVNLRGLPNFIDTRTPGQTLGYSSFWTNPIRYMALRFTRGIFVQSLISGSATVTPTPTPTPNPAQSTGSVRWQTEIDPSTLGSGECEFFDFNWVQLFQASPFYAGQGGNIVPQKIVPVTQDSSGYFKAVVLAGDVSGMSQTVVGGGTVMYDTIRILNLKDLPPSATDRTFTFTFNISYAFSTEGQAVETPVAATLTLTVPATPA